MSDCVHLLAFYDEQTLITMSALRFQALMQQYVRYLMDDGFCEDVEADTLKAINLPVEEWVMSGHAEFALYNLILIRETLRKNRAAKVTALEVADEYADRQYATFGAEYKRRFPRLSYRVQEVDCPACDEGYVMSWGGSFHRGGPDCCEVLCLHCEGTGKVMAQVEKEDFSTTTLTYYTEVGVMTT